MIGLVYRLGDALRRRSLRGNSGRIGEDLAHRYLRRHGCTIVARNYRTPGGSGEIDLVAWQDGKLVFVEVKTRITAEFGEPERAVDADKRERVTRAARLYARQAGVAWEDTRFDIVSIVLEPHRRIDWLRDAFRCAV
jgi:putative endonuclease